MNTHGALTESSLIDHIGNRKGREGKGRGDALPSMHLPHLGAPTLPHASKREGWWDACL